MTKVELASGAEEVPIAAILSQVIEQNLEQRPEKVKDFNSLNVWVGIIVRDYDIEMTLQFEKGKLTLYGGLVGNPPIVITTDSGVLLELPSIKIKFGLPYFFDELGMSAVKKILKRELRIKGLLAHPIALVRLIKVLSVS